MPVPDEVFRRLGLSEPVAWANGQTGAARGLVGNLVVLGAAIALAEIIIEVGGNYNPHGGDYRDGERCG